MPVRTQPWVIQGLSTPAEAARDVLAAMLGAPLVAETPSATLTAGGAHGVVLATDFAVTQNGTPNMSVNVAAGRAFVRATVTESLTAGVYSAFNDGTVNLAIAAADPTNPRRDLVCLQTRDSNYATGGGATDARLFVITGTPAASPSDPTIPANCLVLARVAVAAAAASIVNANITDLRPRARVAWNTSWGTIAYAQTTTAQGSITAITDLTGLSVQFTALATRRYRTRVFLIASSSVNGDTATMTITDGSNVQVQGGTLAMNSSAFQPFVLELIESGLSGTITRKARMARNSGTGNIATGSAAAQVAFIVVEDIGPV
jgi:hypothetical protein